MPAGGHGLRRCVASRLMSEGVQVLGLTNYSMDPAASELRHCIRHDKPTARLALDFAKERLRGMWHVGTYETLRPSLASLASTFGIDVESLAYKSNTAHAFSYDGGDEPEAVCPCIRQTLAT